MQWIQPDPDASLRVLIDRTLQGAAINANRVNTKLQQIHSDSSGHNY
ncbi:hypothetical protein H6F43_16760 [Leptolyngbya sp. FACHB-36]|nr:hypothetical protein [Leptolyngbya sp. FACHB-36]MBD2021834.1 hypothetical protein [Leptolyngbya sp. FACHB-36]